MSTLLSALKVACYTLAVLYIALTFFDFLGAGFTQLFFGPDNSLAGFVGENTLIWAVIPVVLFLLGYILEKRVNRIEGVVVPSMKDELMGAKPTTQTSTAPNDNPKT